jgi:hypothetical protein
MPSKRSPRLKKLLNETTKTADQAQRSFLKAEDVLSNLEQREQQRAARESRPAGAEAELEQRMPAVNPERRGR